ncbi:putative receptor-type tyrosine-protein phosphatase F [Apostichopus japonicus]|uniref:Putative receptor-type tyrosine-protein phosphatase F n=1 Tax=Stichopus japonicus TaxID=307972 RepID=A0A2G8JDH9_STIJA|nr:putative receptor-type tyrosine-protein phosphatase F [Apostichopus japonicus]
MARSSCQIEWEVDWSKQPVDLSHLKSQGNRATFGNVTTIPEVMEVLGLAWNAPSWDVIAGVVCVHYGPLLNSLVGDNFVRSECDEILTSLREDTSSSIVFPCIHVWEKIWEPTNEQRSYIAPPFTNEEIVEKLSPIIFELLGWFGPSPFSGDVFGGCSALRLSLGMDINDIVNRGKTILSYPVALIMEWVYRDNICEEVESRNLTSVFDRIAPLKVYVSFTDGEVCEWLLRSFARDVGARVHKSFNYDTRVDFSSFARQFCSNISLVESSSTDPTAYSVPPGKNMDTWTLENSIHSGELLPGFSVGDGASVLAAFRRSSTLSEGFGVICTVFESFIVQIFPEYAADVSKLCAALFSKDFKFIEQMCLQRTVALQNIGHPNSLRIPDLYYVLSTGVEVARKFLTLEKISKREICESANEFYNSYNNLQTVVRLSVKTYLAEFLPILHNVCQDYDALYEYFSSVFGPITASLEGDDTGYESTELACRDLNRFFSAQLCPDVTDIDVRVSSESNLDTYANVDVTWSYLGAVDSCGIVNQQISFQQLDVMGCEQSSADPIMIELGAETRQYEATYLDAFSLYNVTLTVETRTGHYHKSLQVRTDSTKPTGPPMNLTASLNRKARSVTLQWSDPACRGRNGDIVSFAYAFRESYQSQPITGITEQKQITFPFSNPYKTYSFQVRAATEKGYGPSAVYFSPN